MSVDSVDDPTTLSAETKRNVMVGCVYFHYLTDALSTRQSRSVMHGLANWMTNLQHSVIGTKARPLGGRESSPGPV